MPAKFAKYGITQGFGPTDEPLDSGGVNKGLDFGMPEGTPVDAAVGGTVEAVGNSGDGWGVSIKIRDKDGYLHNYGHLSAVNVRKGQTVGEGSFIARSGNTGKSTGPHLSYDVMAPGGAFIDPTSFVQTGKPGAEPRKTIDDKQDDDALGPADGGGGAGGTDWYGPNVTGEQRVAKLTAAGYSHKSNAGGVLGFGAKGGKDSIWTGPDGKDVREADALARVAQRDVVTSASGGMLDTLKRVVTERLAAGKYDTDTLKMIDQLQKGQDIEAKQLRLDNGTVITAKQIASADPITRQQYQMALDEKKADYENGAIATLNKYKLDNYATGRQATNDANANLNNDYKNRIERVRMKLDLDQITLDEATKEISRMMQGMGESRQRATLEAETALKSAPFATSGGKTSFTGNDLGGIATEQARALGFKDPANTPLISFPGTQKIDVAALMAQRDKELGVTGSLPEIPKHATTAAELPAPPAFAPGPAVPQLQMPAVPPRIALPAPAGDKYAEEAELYGLNRR